MNRQYYERTHTGTNACMHERTNERHRGTKDKIIIGARLGPLRLVVSLEASTTPVGLPAVFSNGSFVARAQQIDRVHANQRSRTSERTKDGTASKARTNKRTRHAKIMPKTLPRRSWDAPGAPPESLKSYQIRSEAPLGAIWGDPGSLGTVPGRFESAPGRLWDTAGTPL